MMILIAAPDRDFLSCYQKLFELRGHTVKAAFDGFQLMGYLQERKFDFVVLDRNLPRVEHDRLVKLVNDLKIPLLVLQGRRMNAKLLMKEALADSYLVYPFLAEEVFERMQEILQKRESSPVLDMDGTSLSIGGFLLENRVRVTNEEINILVYLWETARGAKGRHMGDGSILPVKHGMYYVNALNQKFELLQKQIRIQYKLEEGYELVKCNE